MKVIKHELGDFGEIEILPLADLHIGDIHSDGKKIQEWLSYIEKTPNCFTILNGDLMNTAIKSSVSDTYAETLTPMEQLQQCVKLFGPLKEKVLAVCGGNHEARIYRNDGLDVTSLLCEQLGIGDRYSPGQAMVFVSFGKQSPHKNCQPVLYTILCVHGSGGGKKEGAKLQRLVDLSEIADADIFLHSHTHLPLIARNAYYRVDKRRFAVIKVDRLFVNTSSSIEYGGYGEIQAFRPNSLETPKIILSGRERKMQAIL